MNEWMDESMNEPVFIEHRVLGTVPGDGATAVGKSLRVGRWANTHLSQVSRQEGMEEKEIKERIRLELGWCSHLGW
jgi:hypothetical protein